MDFIFDIIRKYFPTPNNHFTGRSELLFERPDDLMRDLKDFDVVLYRVHDKEDFLGNVISEITSSPYSHATLNITNGYVISADGGGVGYSDLFTNSTQVVVDVLRLNRELTDDEKTGLITKAKEQLLKPYNYFNKRKLKRLLFFYLTFNERQIVIIGAIFLTEPSLHVLSQKIDTLLQGRTSFWGKFHVIKANCGDERRII